MSVLRRRPREVYRVYTEDEYLNGAGLEPTTVEGPEEVEPKVGLAGEEWPAPVEPASKDVRERRLRRMAGVAMLAGAVGTVGGVVAANSSRAHRGAGRRPGNLVAATSSSRVLRSPTVTGSRAVPSGPAVMPPSKATRSHVARVGRRRGGSGSHPHNHLPTHVRARRRGESDIHPPMPPAGVGVRHGGGVAIVVDYSAGSSPGPSTAAGSSSGTGTAEHAEFGFER